jgi:hypothetical protein
LKNVKNAVFRQKTCFFEFSAPFFLTRKHVKPRWHAITFEFKPGREGLAHGTTYYCTSLTQKQEVSIVRVFEKRGMHFFTSILTSCVETWYKPTEEKQKTAKNIDSIKFFAKDIYFFIQYD